CRIPLTARAESTLPSRPTPIMSQPRIPSGWIKSAWPTGRNVCGLRQSSSQSIEGLDFLNVVGFNPGQHFSERVIDYGHRRCAFSLQAHVRVILVLAADGSGKIDDPYAHARK